MRVLLDTHIARLVTSDRTVARYSDAIILA